MALSRNQFASYIKEFSFRELFNEMGWDNDRSSQQIVVDETAYNLSGVAVKSGFKVLICNDGSNGIPAKDIRKKIQRNVAKLYFEHLIIYYDVNRKHQLWQTAVRLPNKPVKINEVEWDSKQDPERLYQKASGLFFTFDEEGIITIVDVLKRINENFNTNSDNSSLNYDIKF